MCGRYASMRETADLVLLTGAADETAPEAAHETAPARDVAPAQSANVAPTDAVRVLLQAGGRRVLRSHRWGLVPPWSKDTTGAARMINARIETIVDKRSYGRAVRTSRCVLPADGWYEWKRVETEGRAHTRTPYLVRREDGRPLWLAGVWARWHPPGDGEPIPTVAVVTGPAPGELEWLHERAPLAVPDRFLDRWLDADGSDPQPVLDSLAGAGYPPLAWHPVSREIGQVRVKSARLMDPVTLDHAGGTADVGCGTSATGAAPLALF
jgi:putative SOS response-associated peptidase YedK